MMNVKKTRQQLDRDSTICAEEHKTGVSGGWGGFLTHVCGLPANHYGFHVCGMCDEQWSDEGDNNE